MKRPVEPGGGTPIADSAASAASTGSPIAVPLLFGILAALVALSVSAVSVSLPALTEELDAGEAAASWVLSGFALALAVGTAVFGRLSDLWSLRRSSTLAVLSLGVGAAVAAGGPSLGAVIGGRVVGGFGGGGITVVALGVLAARYEGSARTRAIAVMIAVVTVVSGCGTLIGGLLVEFASWRFVVGLPILAVLALYPLYRLAPAQVPSGRRLDWRGAVTVTTAAAGVLVLLQSTDGRIPLWLVLSALVAVVGTGIGLVSHLRTTPDGFLPASVVRNRAFLLTALSAAGLQGGYFTMILASPLQLGAADDAVRVGLLLLPAAAFAMGVDLIAGRLASRVGRYNLAVVLAVASTAGLLSAALLGVDAAFVVAFGLGLSGFAAGQSLLNDAALDALPPSDRGTGVGVFNLLLNFGGATAAAAFGGLVGVLPLRRSVAVLAVLPALAAGAALLAQRELSPSRPRMSITQETQ